MDYNEEKSGAKKKEEGSEDEIQEVTFYLLGQLFDRLPGKGRRWQG